MSWHTCMWYSSCSLGTIFVLPLYTPKSLVIIFHTQFFFISSWLAILPTSTTSLTHSTLTTVLLVEGLSLPKTSFTSLWTSCTTQIYVCNIVLSLYTCWSISRAYDSFFNSIENFRFIYCLVFIICSSAFIVEKEEV